MNLSILIKLLILFFGLNFKTSFSMFIPVKPNTRRVTTSTHRTPEAKLEPYQNRKQYVPKSEIIKIKAATSQITCFSFSPDSKYLILGYENGEIKRMCIETKTSQVVYNSLGNIESIFEYEQNKLAFLSMDKDKKKEVTTYDSIKLESKKINFKKTFKNILVSSDGRDLFLICESIKDYGKYSGPGEDIYIKNLTIDDLSLELVENEPGNNIDNKFELLTYLKYSHKAYLAAINIRNDGRKLKIYDISSTKKSKLMEFDISVEIKDIEALEISNTLALVCSNGYFYIADLNNGNISRVNITNVSYVKYLSSPSAIPYRINCVLVILNNGTVNICDLNNMEIVGTFQLFHSNSDNNKKISAAVLSKNGQYLAIKIEGPSSSRIKVFDLLKLRLKNECFAI